MDSFGSCFYSTLCESRWPFCIPTSQSQRRPTMCYFAFFQPYWCFLKCLSLCSWALHIISLAESPLRRPYGSPSRSPASMLLYRYPAYPPPLYILSLIEQISLYYIISANYHSLLFIVAQTSNLSRRLLWCLHLVFTCGRWQTRSRSCIGSAWRPSPCWSTWPCCFIPRRSSSYTHACQVRILSLSASALSISSHKHTTQHTQCTLSHYIYHTH